MTPVSKLAAMPHRELGHCPGVGRPRRRDQVWSSTVAEPAFFWMDSMVFIADARCL